MRLTTDGWKLEKVRPYHGRFWLLSGPSGTLWFRTKREALACFVELLREAMIKLKESR